MSVDFETKCEQHVLDYIKIHLREGYFVNAYVAKGTYHWEKVYKIHVYKKSDAVCESKWGAEQTKPQTDCGDFVDRLAYERGIKHAWEVAQKVFDSTVTFYEAEDMAKQIADAPQTEPSLEQFRVGLEYHTDATHFGKAKGESITTDKTEPQAENEILREQCRAFIDIVKQTEPKGESDEKSI